MPEKSKLLRCSRCKQGRLMLDAEGDGTCFNCGHVVYANPAPLDLPLRAVRAPSHGGVSLS